MKVSATGLLPFRVVSLVLALVLYLFVMQDKEGERVFNVSVVIESEPDGYMLLSDVPQLQVTVAGRARNLTRLDEDRLSELPLRIDTLETHHDFGPSDFDLPPGLEVRSISPNTVAFNFERKIEAEVPIRLDVRGATPYGFRMQTILSPETIHVTGPATEINALEGLFTLPFDVGGIREDQPPRPVGLVQEGPRLSYDRETPVHVTVLVERNEVALDVAAVPVRISGPVARFTIEPPHISIRLRGPEELIDELDPTRLSATVDTLPFAEAAEGTYEVAPRLVNLPDQIRVEEMSYDTIQLTVAPFAQVPAIDCLPIPLPNLFPLALPRYAPAQLAVPVSADSPG